MREHNCQNKRTKEMKIGITSDLHIEWLHLRGDMLMLMHLDTKLPNPEDIDVLVIAGDLCSTKEMWIVWKHLSNRFKHVVGVLGNHEFYGSDVNGPKELAREINSEFENVHILMRDVVEIEGQRFIGTSLWFPNRSALDPDWHWNSRRLTDFSAIRGFRPWIGWENSRDVKFLTKNIREGDIVVTHHAPSWESVQPIWRGNDMNDFYITDMTRSSIWPLPNLWIHGHMHGTNEYVPTDGPNKVICNPGGYPEAQENPAYKMWIEEVDNVDGIDG